MIRPAMPRHTGLFLLICLVSFTGGAAAQWRSFNFSAGAGFTVPAETTSNSVDTGWNVDFRGGVNATRQLALDLDFNYNRADLNNAALLRAQEPGGHVSIWSLTFNPVYHILPPRSRVNAYGTAGFGLYHRDLTFTQPVVFNTFFCDPFFGCFPGAFTTNQVIASFDIYKAGFNAGAGVEYRVGDSHLKLFGEARYHRMFTTNGHDLTYIPTTFGLRW
jgi:opacity protein-like surface antigen